ncbi:uncharacterized protein VTP21DRAFT_4824 [Calcarisporiella thermophila]|uniref:uncharacterized protein n=1 Tax=Calcarisporiella thermophila TaxID=911321 RepID=UPI0037433C71
MMKIFSISKPPARTTITENIDFLTHPSQDTENWQVLFTTVEEVNRQPEGAREAAKALRRRLKAGDGKTTILSITVMQCLVENCGKRFHDQMARPHFLEDLKQCYYSRSTSDLGRQRILSLLYHCKNIFNGVNELKSVGKLCDELSGGNKRSPGEGNNNNFSFATSQIPQLDERMEREVLSAITAETIENDITIAKSNSQLLTETLSFTNPESVNPEQHDIIQEFRTKCRDSQATILRHIQQSADNNDGELMRRLLETNQLLVQAFKQYDEMVERHCIANATKASKTVNWRGTDEETKLHGNVEGDLLGGHEAVMNGSKSNGHFTYSEASSSMAAGVDPFADDIVEEVPQRPSAKALGKQPAHLHETLAQNETSYPH